MDGPGYGRGIEGPCCDRPEVDWESVGSSGQVSRASVLGSQTESIRGRGHPGEGSHRVQGHYPCGYSCHCEPTVKIPDAGAQGQDQGVSEVSGASR